MKKLCLAFLLLSINAAYLYADNYKYRFFSAQYHYNYLWPHRIELKPLLGDAPVAYEFKLGWRTTGSMHWHRNFNLPSYGVGFYYCDLGNPDELGEVRSGFLFMEFDLGGPESFSRRLNLALGISHLNRYYHPERNPGNRFIGTPMNVHFNINYSWLMPLTESIWLKPGFSFTHFSNGAYRKPNRGLNLFDVNLGLRYRMPGGAGIAQSYEDHKPHDHLPRQYLLMTYSLGFMQRTEDDPVYRARTFTLNSNIRRKQHTAWGIGLDVFYDDHAKEMARSLRENTSIANYTRLGGFASFDVVFDGLSIMFNLGTYLYYGYDPLSQVYKRVGLRYITNSGLLGHIALKAHAGRADYIEWGIGYSIGY